MAVTGKDEDNFIAVNSPRIRLGQPHDRAGQRSENERAFNELGVDVPIGATVILGKIIEEEASFSDFVDLFSFKRGKLALIRVDLPETSPIINKRVQDLQLPPVRFWFPLFAPMRSLFRKGIRFAARDDVIALTLVENKQQLLNYLIGDV